MKHYCMGLLQKSLILAVLSIGFSAQAKVVLPAVFSDNMVLQQKTNAAIWGKTDAGKTVRISITWSKKSYSAKADQTGNWKIMIPTPSYGGPYEMTISDGDKTILKNMLIGEVWLCSGQSNMQLPLAGWGKINNYQQEIADANYPNIRLLQAEHIASNTPLEDVKVQYGGWNPCTPQNIAEFSAVAYFFAREIYKKKGVPIGLIHTSWGGTIAEAWTSGETLKNMPDFAMAADKIAQSGQVKSTLSYAQQLEAWNRALMQKDAGYAQQKPIWVASSFDATAWKTMVVPAFWEQSALPDFNGVVWFRKKVIIPASWAGKELKIYLGTIDDDDIAYFDGEKVGETQGFTKNRVYTIPADKVKAGEFALAVRVFDGAGGGGFYGDKNVVSVASANGGRVSLDGDWQYKEGVNLKDIDAMPASDNEPNRPTVLYNAMVHPFIQFAIKGAIWYQGESNADRASQYRTLFPAMITDWRKYWNIGDFPFYYVQLANFMKVNEQPVASAWAELRDAQLQTLSVPNTGMAVAIDIGDAVDIHPKNKQEVGRRLALIALANTYGEKIAYSGPLFQSQKISGSAIKLNFKFNEGGLKAKDGGVLTGFSIAGADQKFHWAKAVVQGNEISVSSDEVQHPVAVRYAWADNPVCNLVNGAGLPASPFRTDKWTESTYGKK
ncbi:sialate O-acetylesterase [Arcticibacter eurypsychrophilus]|uniref:sialate O-acetylesterase n=1 Tax=Arcticibacter eurypsychrophilus TaxID=1434752 RepID=UPI00084E00C6|nr:sialate O-acetylesterase [Arcticibacter eurypsychrophilus]